MRHPLKILAACLLLTSLAGLTWAVDRFPPPDFTNHPLPVVVVPEARPELYNYLDLAALIFGLALASYLSLVRRSRKGLFLLSMAALLWLGFWRKGCVCPIGSIQNVSLALFDAAYAIPFSVVLFFALPLLFTLFFGRTFCAAVCPLGAVQELVAVRPVKVPDWLEQVLGLLPFIYLGAAVALAATGTAFLICEYDPFVGFFRFSASKMVLVGLCFLVLGIFVGRPYCRYLCPYGALLGLASRVSKWHMRIPPEECIKCRLCVDACPYGALREPTVPPSPERLVKGRRRLGVLLILLPLLIAGSAILGNRLGLPLSYMHPSVRLAEQLRLEETGQVTEPVDMTNAFRNTGRPASELYLEVIALREQFGVAGAWLGAWIGLVLGVKLIHLTIRRQRVEYQPDRANCVSCGRCFWYCPCEQVRLGLIQTLPLVALPPEKEVLGTTGARG